MNDFNIRITHREGEAERIVEIDCYAPQRPAEQRVSYSGAEPRLEWSSTLCDGKRVDYAAAEKACTALGEGWRLPTRMELESILDLTRHEPAVDTARFPDTQSGAYWTSTPCAWSSGFAWVVYFRDGSAYLFRRDSYDAFVRAVRASPPGQ